ncbi:MAG: hypothetical protein ACRDH7_16495 [Actinomycetota bacterium]
MATHAPAHPRTTATRVSLVVGAVLTAAAGALILARRPHDAAACAGASGVLLLIGGHRSNHGAGDPLDRMLDALLDRLWDGVILASIAWAARGPSPHIAAAALAALGASFLSSYVRARGASLGYTVEESHVTRGLRYALIVAGLAFGWLGWSVWSTFGISVLAVVVRTSQVAKEERA